MILILLSLIAGLLYYIGGCSKEEIKKRFPFFPSQFVNTKVRDFGVPLIACTVLTLLHGWHWSLLLVFILMFGSMTTYHKWINRLLDKPEDNVYWYGWAMTGLCYGLSVGPYIFTQGLSIPNYIIMSTLLSGFITLWSEKIDDVVLEASGRGVAVIIFLISL